MQSHAVPSRPLDAPTITSVRIETTLGSIETWISNPGIARNPEPALIAVHGITRDAAGQIEAFAAERGAIGRTIIAPHFDARTLPVFQRITNRHRADRALLDILTTLRQRGLIDGGPCDLFGYSGGAQFAHRFAMLYPQRIRSLHLGAAGWYCMPTPETPYPAGLGPSHAGRADWPRRMAAGLDRLLRRPIRIYVGDQDTRDDPSLRRSAELDDRQGPHRLARARSYAEALRATAADRGIPADIGLTVLAGCGHSFTDCNRAGLAGLVLAPTTPAKG